MSRWQTEYAKSSRASCKACRDTIEKDTLRIGKWVPSSHFDGDVVMWYHYKCIKKGSIPSIVNVEGFSSVNPTDQERVRKLCADYVDVSGGAAGASSASTAAGASASKSAANSKAAKLQENVALLQQAGGVSHDRLRVSYAESNRSSCRSCKNRIDEDEIRIGYVVSLPNVPMPVPQWNHLQCFVTSAVPPASIDAIQGIGDLESRDASKVKQALTGMLQAKATEIKIAVAEAAGATKPTTGSDAKGSAADAVSGDTASIMKIYDALPPALQSPNFDIPTVANLGSFTVAQLRAILDACKADSTPKLKAQLVTAIKTLIADSSDNGFQKALAAFHTHPAFQALRVVASSNSNPVSGVSGAAAGASNAMDDGYRRALAATQEEGKHLWEAREKVLDLPLEVLLDMLLLNRQPSYKDARDRVLERVCWGMVYGALPACPRCNTISSLRVTQEGHIVCRKQIDDWTICPFVADSVALHPWRFTTKKAQLPKFSEEERKSAEWAENFVAHQPFDSAKTTTSQSEEVSLDKATADEIEAMLKEQAPWVKSWTFKPHLPILWAHRAIKKEKDARAQASNAQQAMLQSALGSKRGNAAAEEEEKGEKKKVKVQIKGRCAVNQDFDYARYAHVLDEGSGKGELWDAPMSVTDLQSGRNSFYHLQLLAHDTNKNSFWVFRQWGRVGDAGKGGSTYRAFASLAAAKDEFRGLFLEKTGNEWGSATYSRYPGKFFPVETVYADAEPQDDQSEPESCLDKRVKRIVDMIFDKKRMEAALAELEIDVEKMPLGQLSEKRIKDGFAALEVLDQLVQNIFPVDLDAQVESATAASTPEGVETKDAFKSMTSMQVLQTILGQVSKENENLLLNANNRFYTLIPHTLPPALTGGSPLANAWVIKTRAQIKEKTELLQTLQDMLQAYSINRAAAAAKRDASAAMSAEALTPEERLAQSKNSSDIKYRSLKNKFVPLDRDSEEWKNLEMYLSNTHAATHNSYTLELKDIFVIEREGEQERFDKYCLDVFGTDSNSNVVSASSADAAAAAAAAAAAEAAEAEAATTKRGRGRGGRGKKKADVDNDESKMGTSSNSNVVDGKEVYERDPRKRELLWHGSRLTNFGGILSQGLRIAPPEAPATGYMFGKGIYLADMVSKSANYCFAQPANPEALILLCEAALGEKYRLTRSEYVTKLRDGLHSTYGMGGTAPDPSSAIYTPDGMKIPLGKGGRNNDLQNKPSSLLYNEYIVYSESQVRLRYLLNIKFNYKYGW